MATNIKNCDRCGQTWKAKPDGFIDEALELEMDAHREHCFIVGDSVRWTPHVDRWVDGVIAKLVGEYYVLITTTDTSSNLREGWTPGFQTQAARSLVRRSKPRFSPGDRVRWTNPEDKTWADCAVLRCGQSVSVRVYAVGPGWSVPCASVGDAVDLVHQVLESIPAPAMPPRCQRCNNHPCLCEKSMASTVPVCCGKPMRKTGMGDGWICDQNTGGSYCERFQGPNGVRTPSQWWRHSGTPARPEWMRALGAVYEAEPITQASAPVVDPLAVKYDELDLAFLLKCYRLNQQQNETSTFSPAQRVAITEHWSAELRAKVSASEDAQRKAAEDLRIAMTELYSEEWD